MVNVFTRKLELFGPLPDTDKHLLEEVVKNGRVIEAETSIIRQGDSPRDVHLVMTGMAYRSKTLQDGRRQIFAYLLPGDFCDLNVFILSAMDHDIETLSRSSVVKIPRPQILEMMDRPALARALWWATLVDEATLREWLVNLGQRDAEHRLAHLFCEIHARLSALDLTSDGAFELPITQVQLAETMGLSRAHMNHALQQLRARNLLDLKGGLLAIRDIGTLRTMSGFNPAYLHLRGGKRDATR